MGITQQDAVFFGDEHDAGAAGNASMDFAGVLTGQADCFKTLPHIAVYNNTAEGIDDIAKKV